MRSIAVESQSVPRHSCQRSPQGYGVVSHTQPVAGGLPFMQSHAALQRFEIRLPIRIGGIEVELGVRGNID